MAGLTIGRGRRKGVAGWRPDVDARPEEADDVVGRSYLSVGLAEEEEEADRGRSDAGACTDGGGRTVVTDVRLAEKLR